MSAVFFKFELPSVTVINRAAKLQSLFDVNDEEFMSWFLGWFCE